MPHALTPPADFFPALANRKRWTRADCKFLEQVGVLRERYELIDGEIIEMGQNRPHIMAISRVLAWLLRLFDASRVQSQADIDVAENDRETNRPQPDAAVLAQPDFNYTETVPGRDVVLLVEVSDATLRDDLTTKMRLYARAGVAEYWVLDVTSRRLIVHRQPTNGAYGEIAAFLEDETLASLAAPSQTIRVANLLPPVSA